MKKIILAITLLVVAHTTTKAQQDPRFSQYMFNQLVINPAYTGTTEALSLSLLGRYQWVGIDGSPQTGTLSGHLPLGTDKKAGVGAYLAYDKIGVTQTTAFFGSYAYKFILGESRLSVGLNGGINYLSTDDSQLQTNPIMDPVTGDPVFQQGSLKRLLPNFGLGLYFYKPNKYYMGVSAPHLLNNNLRDEEATIALIAKQYRQYNFMAGGVIGQGAFKFRPSMLVKAVPTNAPVQVDLSAMFLIKDMLWLGGSYRTAVGNRNEAGSVQAIATESADAIVGFQFQNGLRLSYAYDLTLSKLQQFTTGSHEIMIGYDIKGKGVRYHTPRYF